MLFNFANPRTTNRLLTFIPLFGKTIPASLMTGPDGALPFVFQNSTGMRSRWKFAASFSQTTNHRKLFVYYMPKKFIILNSPAILPGSVAKSAKSHVSACTKKEKNAGDTEIEIAPLSERIRFILQIIQRQPVKSTTMNYLILYDIEKNKVRNLVAKYLLSRGCIRIQKSVFLAHTEHKKF